MPSAILGDIIIYNWDTTRLHVNWECPSTHAQNVAWSRGVVILGGAIPLPGVPIWHCSPLNQTVSRRGGKLKPKKYRKVKELNLKNLQLKAIVGNSKGRTITIYTSNLLKMELPGRPVAGLGGVKFFRNRPRTDWACLLPSCSTSWLCHVVVRSITTNTSWE